MSSTDSPRPPAFIHVDCDSRWVVKSCYDLHEETPPEGDAFWLEGMPQALHLFGDLGIPATFFVVSMDMKWESHIALAKEALAKGHEIASHAATHVMSLRKAAPDLLHDEISRSKIEISDALDVDVKGFRSPGFSWAESMANVISNAGYLYDTSVFASPWGPVLRGLRKRMGKASETDQEPYGSMGDGWAPRGPHRRGDLVELPVSLTPWLRLPAHASFALLRSTDRAFANTVRWHAERSIPLVWVIHFIDLCDTESLDLPTPGWAKRALCQSGEVKRDRLRRMLGIIQNHFDIVRTDEWVQSEFDRL